MLTIINKRVNLVNLKSGVHKLDNDKLKTVAINLKKLRDVVENDVVKQCRRTSIICFIDRS